MQGWIKLHRKILDHWCASEPEALAVWCRLMLEANHKTNKKMFNGKLIEIKRGQLIFGLNAFSAKSGVSVAKIRRYLKLFETEQMISKQITSKFSVITITCFDDYQGDDKQNTSKTQADDKQATTPKECKNEKNERNIDRFDYEAVVQVWNESCSESITPSKKSRVVTEKLKKILPKTYEKYVKVKKSNGNEPSNRMDFCKAYFPLVLEWGQPWVGSSGPNESWKMNLDHAAKVDTYDKVVEWATND